MLPMKRHISGDNSCLFNAFSYCFDKSGHNDNSSSNLRSLVAKQIENNEEKYNDIFLGKPNKEYQTYILNPNNWGGAIELSILSEVFNIKISAFDIKTLKKHCFGEDMSYSDIIYLLYDGMHYDSLIMTYDKQLPFEFDITRFLADDLETTQKMVCFVFELK